MANLHIRNVPEPVRRGLRLRAARKRHSMEAEARAILAEAVQRDNGKEFDPQSLQNFILGLFKGKPPRLADELIKERRREVRMELQEIETGHARRSRAGRAR